MFIHTLALFVTVAQSLAPVQAPPASPYETLWRQAAPQAHTQQSQQHGAWLGVSLRDGKGGPTVGQVVEHSPAEHAGFEPGDRIVSIDGKPVASTNAVIEIVRQAHQGTKVTVVVRREISVALDDEHKSAKGAFVLGVELGSQRKVGDDDAIEVKSVLDGSPAQNAGIGAGDALINVEGKHVASSAHVTSALEPVTEAREVKVEIARAIEVTLGTPRADLTLELGQQRQATPPPAAGPQAPKNAKPKGNQLATPPPAAGPQPPKTALPRSNQPAAPRARTPAPGSDEALLEEVRALSRELRELRDQIAALRGQLEQLQGRR